MTMLCLSLTLPLLPGKAEAWRRFCQELSGVRQKEYEASRQQLGIVQEQFTPVETSLGTAVQLTIQAPDVGSALTRLAASNSPFDRWFKEKLGEMHGFWLAGAAGRSHEATTLTPHFMWPSEAESYQQPVTAV